MNNDLRSITTLPPFKRMCMTIGELPTSYLETMTYYEMLVWFTEYMKNTIIPTINNNGLAVKELQNKYIELKNFVDNYFDNLDVQEEINNKLDEMASDGTLEEIISSYLNTISPLCFDNVESMKASINLVNGSYAKTLGYHSINDGGGAFYKINETGTNDNMYSIELNNGLIAHLIIQDYITPEVLGAYGDNIHDDTIPVQECLSNTDYLHSVLSKKYKVTTGLSVANYKVVDGGGYIYSSGECFLLDGCARITIRDLKLFPTTNAIHITSTNRWTNYNLFEDIYCYGNNTADKGLYIQPTTNYINEQTYRNCSFMNFNYGIYADNSTENKEMASHKFYDCSTEGSQTLGQYIKKGDLFSFINCRHAESISNKWTTEGVCNSLLIYGGYIGANTPSNINFSSDTNGMMIGNLRYTQIYASAVERSAYIIKGKVIPTLNSTSFDRQNIGQDTSVDYMTSGIYHFFNFNNDVECTLTLSPDIYGGQGKINEIFVRVSGKTNTSTVVIGSFSKTLPAGSYDKYRFTFSTLSGPPGSWIVEKITEV